MEVSVEYPSGLEVGGVHRNEERIWLGLLCLHIQCAQLDSSDFGQAVCEAGEMWCDVVHRLECVECRCVGDY